MPGAHNVVPDFLACPWNGTSDEAPAAIHVLAACTSRRMRKTAAPMPVHSVVVLPSWQGSMAVQTKHQRMGLWSVTTGTNETSREAASLAVRSLEQDLGAAPNLICFPHTQGVSLWRAKFGSDHMPCSLNSTCQWMSSQALPQHKHWYQPHFDVSEFGARVTIVLYSRLVVTRAWATKRSVRLKVLSHQRIYLACPHYYTISVLQYLMTPLWETCYRLNLTQMTIVIRIFRRRQPPSLISSK